MVGINAATGKVLSGFPHVEQCLQKLFDTGLAQRIMREWVGNPGTKLIGENATERNILSWATIVWTLVEIYEPRYRILRFEPNSVDRSGTFDVTLVGEHRPYGHKNWQQSNVFVSVVDDVVTVKQAA
ncbi:hypothetical protein [Maritalea porphyrae]|uniref:hypothetical protein n=1 Tax=Maritalea porphyrae TaxID=880732 RepID=UPI0022B03F5C|nr:hypothetical protein [Maritalea porphyrae]MCZ4270718.1 hypothetical protein [Maritalea porphyrae]